MENLLNEYEKKFNDNFPIFLLRGKTDNELESIIKECIKNNKKYEVEIDNNVDY